MIHFAIEAHASRYVEGFYACYGALTIGRRTFYVQRGRANAYRFPQRNGIRRLVLYAGPVWGIDIGTWRTA